MVNLDDLLKSDANDYVAPKEVSNSFPQFKPNPKKHKGKYSATIRFIPNPMDSKYSIFTNQVMYLTGKGEMEGERLYLQNPKMLSKSEKECFVMETFWRYKNNKDNAAHQEIAKGIGGCATRNISYIYVVSDETVPDNNGKFMVWEYGSKILKKIETLRNPTSSKKKSSEPFKLDKSKEFSVVMTVFGGEVNVDACEFLDDDTAFSYDSDGTKTILNDKATKLRLQKDLSGLPDLKDVYGYKEWRDNEDKVHTAKLILDSITGTDNKVSNLLKSKNVVVEGDFGLVQLKDTPVNTKPVSKTKTHPKDDVDSNSAELDDETMAFLNELG